MVKAETTEEGSAASKRPRELMLQETQKTLDRYRQQLIDGSPERAREIQLRVPTNQELMLLVTKIGDHDLEGSVALVHLQVQLANAKLDALKAFVAEQADQQAAFNEKVQGFMSEVSALDIWPEGRGYLVVYEGLEVCENEDAKATYSVEESAR